MQNQPSENKWVKCPRCGTEYTSGGNCPNCGALSAETPTAQSSAPQKPKKAWYKKWWIWVIVGVLLVGGIGSRFAKKTDKAPSTNNISSQSQTTEQNADSTAQEKTEAPKVEETKATAAKTEKEFYVVGDSYESNGLTLTIDSCEKYVDDNEFIHPESGNIFIRAHMTFDNQSGKDRSVGTTLFKAYADNKSVDIQHLVGDDILSLYDSISSGRTASGYLYLEIPEGSQVELEYTPSLYSKSEKIIYKLEY